MSIRNGNIKFPSQPAIPGKGPKPPEPRFQVPTFMVQDLRDWLQDYDALNEVISGQEFDDVKLAKSLVQAMMLYNATAPIAPELQISDLIPGKITSEQYILVLDIAAARALQSVIFMLMRNHITYQDGNINKQINERWRYYDTAISRLVGGQTGSDGSYARVKEFKVALNVSFCTEVSLSPLSRWSYPYTGDFVSVY